MTDLNLNMKVYAKACEHARECIAHFGTGDCIRATYKEWFEDYCDTNDVSFKKQPKKPTTVEDVEARLFCAARELPFASRASDRQVAYLASLMHKAGDYAWSGPLSKRDASDYIGRYLSDTV